MKQYDKIIYKDSSVLKCYNGSHKTERSVGVLKKSLEDYGFQQPIIIDKENNIVAGNGLLKAALDLNIKEVPCVILEDLTEEEINQYRIADNKTSEFATWNEAKLKKELSYLNTPQSLQYLFDEDINTMLGFNIVPQIRRTTTLSKTNNHININEREDEKQRFEDDVKKVELEQMVNPFEYIEYICSKCGKRVKVKKN